MAARRAAVPRRGRRGAGRRWQIQIRRGPGMDPPRPQGHTGRESCAAVGRPWPRPASNCNRPSISRANRRARAGLHRRKTRPGAGQTPPGDGRSRKVQAVQHWTRCHRPGHRRVSAEPHPIRHLARHRSAPGRGRTEPHERSLWRAILPWRRRRLLASPGVPPGAGMPSDNGAEAPGVDCPG